MHCTLVCITTDNYDVFYSNVATFQLAESKDLILGCQVLFSDCLNKLRILKRGFTEFTNSCWSLNYVEFTCGLESSGLNLHLGDLCLMF